MIRVILLVNALLVYSLLNAQEWQPVEWPVLKHYD